jgi:hypothetical protein
MAVVTAPFEAGAQQGGKGYRVAYVAIAPRTTAEVAEQPPYLRATL